MSRYGEPPSGNVLHQKAFPAALHRELDYYFRHAGDMVLSVAILVLSMVAVSWTFTSGTIREIPVAVIDQDGSALSRNYIRMLDAAPELYIKQHLTSPRAAENLLKNASVYAAVLIPKGFAKNVKTGKRATVVVWHSGQLLTISGVVLKSLRKVTGTLSAAIEVTSLTRRGDSTLSAQVNFEPVQPELRTLFNPFQNYQYFLVAGLLPAMLQVFVMIWSAFAVGREFRDHSSSDWLHRGKTVGAAILAKLLPIFVIASVIGLACLAWLHGYAGWPVNGSFMMLILGWELMIVVYLVLGLLVAAFIPKLAMALSFSAFYTAPAFAYAGITFPQHAMPAIAQLWTYALPVRTLLKLQIEQAQVGVPLSNSIPEVFILIAFAVLPLPIASWRIRRRCELAARSGR